VLFSSKLITQALLPAARAAKSSKTPHSIFQQIETTSSIANSTSSTTVTGDSSLIMQHIILNFFHGRLINYAARSIKLATDAEYEAYAHAYFSFPTIYTFTKAVRNE